MKKKNKKIVSAALAFSASICVLAGSVLAWWIANDTFAGSNLTTGNAEVDVELYIYDVENVGGAAWVKDTTKQITVEDMIPGDSRFYAIKVINVGPFTGVPSFTLNTITEAVGAGEDTLHIKDYKLNVPTEGSPTFVEEDTYMLSKMMILDVHAVVESNHADLDDPEPRVVSSVATAADQTVAVDDSIYDKTTGITEDFIQIALDDNEPAEEIEIAPEGILFFIVEFHFSGEAGNEYQDTKMTIDDIIIGIKQSPSSQII